LSALVTPDPPRCRAGTEQECVLRARLPDQRDGSRRADTLTDQYAPSLRSFLVQSDGISLQVEHLLDVPRLRLPSQTLGGRNTVVVRHTPSYWYLRLYLRHAQVRIHHGHQQGNRVAEDTISSGGVEGKCDLIRAYGTASTLNSAREASRLRSSPLPHLSLAYLSNDLRRHVYGGGRRK
jgi:hypothetical protein